MALDGALGQHERLGDVAVRAALGHEPGHLDLSRSESSRQRHRPAVTFDKSRQLGNAAGKPAPSLTATDVARRLQELDGPQPVLVRSTAESRRGLIDVGAGGPDVGPIGAVDRPRGLEVCDRVVGSALHRRELTERAVDRPAHNFPAAAADKVGERQEGVMDQGREVRVSDTGDDLCEHRHPKGPAVVERHGLRPAAHQFVCQSARLVRPASLEAGEREQTSKQAISRVHRPRRNEPVLELPQSALLPPKRC